MIRPTVKALIFDLGGVILDLSVDHTLQAFSRLFSTDIATVKTVYHSEIRFQLFEKGLLNDQQFRSFVREIFHSNISDDQIDHCWNAMLLGIPAANLTLLKRLMQSHQVLLLSNTNNIHLKHINDVILNPLGEKSLDPFFHRSYYSHLIQMRKPDAEIFHYVLKENNLQPSEVLFLDDNQLNIEGANAVGIKTVHVTSSDFILDYFHA